MDGIRELLVSGRSSSVAYGVSRGVDTVLIGADGFANRSSGALATTETPYSLASITKPITATALMILVERGLVKLDRPINHYLARGISSRAGDASKVTMEMVLNHTSGLPLHYQFFYEDELYPRPPMDETIRRYAKTFSPPGERYLYSNLGYGLLDHLIETVAGQSYAEFMSTEVFQPLGMQDSSIGPSEGAAVSYGCGFAYPPYTFDHPGGSAAFASVEDLLRFGQFHLGLISGPLSLDSVRQMQVPSAQVDDSSGYALGWSLGERLGRTVVQHSGSMGGVRTMLRLIPSLEAVIVILSNGEDDFPFQAVADIQAELDPPAKELLAASRSRLQAPTEKPPVPKELRRLFAGKLETHSQDLPFAVDLSSAQSILDGDESEIVDLHLKDGYVKGVFRGDVKTDDASSRPYRLHLDLSPTSAGLQGAVVAITEWSENQRTGNALSYWVELTAV
jgi:CubicO group peptidase (beta-lactamase class C family)